MRSFILHLPAFFLLVNLAACGLSGDASYPEDQERTRKEERGRLTGEGLTLFGGDDEEKEAAASPIGVNSFLWRATLDTLSFMPFTSADPFGGVIITDWYEDPATSGERFKVTALILDRSLRADGIKISLFKQQRQKTGEWMDIAVNPSVARDLENTILTRARQLRVKQEAK